MSIHVDTIFRLYDTEIGGYYFEISPDPDGLNCVEVTYVESDRHHYERKLTVSPEMAIAIGEKIIQLGKIMEKQEL